LGSPIDCEHRSVWTQGGTHRGKYAVRRSLGHRPGIWLLWRLKRVGDPSLPHPLIVLEGDSFGMRGLSVTITDAGQQVISGAANAVELNGIDDWIGNVHLSSAANRVWFAGGGHVIC